MLRNLLISIAALFLSASAVAAATPITIDAVLEAMNARRVAEGLPPLRGSAVLHDAAGDRVRDMEELGYWAHRSPDGRSPFTWLRARGYDFSYAGENLATGYETTEILVASWMESEGHRENIMSPIFSEVGIALIDGSTVKRSIGKSVVVLFARPQTVSPKPSSRKSATPAATGAPAAASGKRVAIAPPHTFDGTALPARDSRP